MTLFVKLAMTIFWAFGILCKVDSSFQMIPGNDLIFAVALGSMCMAGATVFLDRS